MYCFKCGKVIDMNDRLNGHENCIISYGPYKTVLRATYEKDEIEHVYIKVER